MAIVKATPLAIGYMESVLAGKNMKRKITIAEATNALSCNMVLQSKKLLISLLLRFIAHMGIS